ncbi:MAG: hypothetical protein HOU81_18135 [Hamadaea sp.]|uniref:hypothetical protein n=1 Tax=Hamadaea sp. TaxID=2024425 RepID=UPI0018565DEE|nr:hypothetical protein [Hamadaea sp.]NUR72736.1 hypothetical protein [Hamadaea sp.]NUT18430.1 hypothetical protein [Hamadaea sp.]
MGRAKIWLPYGHPPRQRGRVQACPTGHGLMRPAWSMCLDCGLYCRHWECAECAQELRDVTHVCRSG